MLELAPGFLLLLGLARLPAYIVLAAILVTVTYGHLLLDPLFSTTGHIFPRLVLLLFLFVAPRRHDLLALDHVIARRRASSPAS